MAKSNSKRLTKKVERRIEEKDKKLGITYNEFDSNCFEFWADADKYVAEKEVRYRINR